MVRWELRDRENQVEDQHNNERWRLGHESVIRGHHVFKDIRMIDLDHVYLTHVLNKPCSSTGRKYALNNNMCLITRCT